MRSGTDFDPLDLANQFMSPSLLPLAEYDALDPPCNALPLERDGHKTRGRWATFLVLEIRFQHVVPTACECFVILYLENVSLAEVDYATHLFLSGTHNGADAKIGSRDQHAASLRFYLKLEPDCTSLQGEANNKATQNPQRYIYAGMYTGRPVHDPNDHLVQAPSALRAPTCRGVCIGSLGKLFSILFWALN